MSSNQGYSSPGIAGSGAIATGLAAVSTMTGETILLAARLPAWIGVLAVGFFALYHGHAHFTEMADGVSVAAFAAGMLAATTLLHLTGLGFALGAASLQDRLPRLLGGALSAAGAWLMLASY